MAEKFELRSVFNENVIKNIATNISHAYPTFKKDAFTQALLENFFELNFLERNNKITQTLYKYLPNDFEEAVTILLNALGEELQVQELEGYEGFYVMPYCTYVAEYGQNHFELSMKAQIEMTKRFSAEFSIRTFLINEPHRTLAFLKTQATSDNCHVRRLLSEGTRPRLPLGKRLHQFIKEPQHVFEVLELLKNEPTRLVQRSIANNLNDIAKDNPNDVIDFLAKWKKENVKDITWIITHATRTLVKAGHQPTLTLLGYEQNLKLDVSHFTLATQSVTLGESLEFSLTLTSHESESKPIIIDYLMYFKKANGTLSPKVFKLKTTTLKPNETLHITKRHPIKFATTRKYYEGMQKISLQINGTVMSPSLEFHLKVNNV